MFFTLLLNLITNYLYICMYIFIGTHLSEPRTGWRRKSLCATIIQTPPTTTGWWTDQRERIIEILIDWLVDELIDVLIDWFMEPGYHSNRNGGGSTSSLWYASHASSLSYTQVGYHLPPGSPRKHETQVDFFTS